MNKNNQTIKDKLRGIIAEIVSQALLESVNDYQLNHPCATFEECMGLLDPKEGNEPGKCIINGNIYEYDPKRWRQAFDDLKRINRDEPISGRDFLSYLNNTNILGPDRGKDAYKNMTPSDRRATMERNGNIINRYLGEYYNAYAAFIQGYTYEHWRQNCHISDEHDAKVVWEAAVGKASLRRQ